MTLQQNMFQSIVNVHWPDDGEDSYLQPGPFDVGSGIVAIPVYSECRGDLTSSDGNGYGIWRLPDDNLSPYYGGAFESVPFLAESFEYHCFPVSPLYIHMGLVIVGTTVEVTLTDLYPTGNLGELGSWNLDFSGTIYRQPFSAGGSKYGPGDQTWEVTNIIRSTGSPEGHPSQQLLLTFTPIWPQVP